MFFNSVIFLATSVCDFWNSLADKRLFIYLILILLGDVFWGFKVVNQFDVEAPYISYGDIR